MNEPELEKAITEYIKKSGLDGTIQAICNIWPSLKSLIINWSDMEYHNRELSEEIQSEPIRCIWAFERAIKKSMPPDNNKLEMHARFAGVGKNTNWNLSIRKLRTEHLGSLISTTGMVRRVTQVKPKIIDAAFQCVRCRAIIREPQFETFTEPLECYKDQGGCGKSCASTRFVLITKERVLNKDDGMGGIMNPSTFIDTQKIELQEIPEDLRGGEQPERLTAYVEDDLCARVQPGDVVTLVGTLRSRRKGIGKSLAFETYLDVNYIEPVTHDYEEIKLTDEDEIRIKNISTDPDLFNKLRQSIAPSIYGLDLIKEALVLQMFGGVSKTLPDGNRLRGDLHILLIGDPGIAKSQILRHVAEVSPRGVFASGKASTAAGLTAAAVKDSEFGEGRWTLEAGSLVLADKGICCIDELGQMDERDRSAIHEAMEQQRITVNKAGINATLQCRCAILAAMNPRYGRWDEHEYIYDQMDLKPTLLSRFDAIFPLVDKPTEASDYDLAEHILDTHRSGEARNKATIDELRPDGVPTTPRIDRATMRKYVAYAKLHVQPVMTKECMTKLRLYYVNIRNNNKSESSKCIPMTPRQLEGMIRMSEAGAKARLSPEVSVADAERAIKIMEHYLKSVASDSGNLDIDAIMTGSTKSQRDRVDAIKEILKEAGELDEEELLQKCVQNGIPMQKAVRDIKRLKDMNVLYSPDGKKLKLIGGLY